GPGVFERDRAVENQVRVSNSGFRVVGDVETEVTQALKLIAQVGPRVFQARFALRGQHLQRVRVNVLLEIADGVGFGHREEAIVEAHFGVNRVRGTDPVNGPLDLASGSGAAGLTVEIGHTVEFDDVPGRIFDHLLALDYVSIFQAHLTTGTQTEVFRRWHLH